MLSSRFKFFSRRILNLRLSVDWSGTLPLIYIFENITLVKTTDPTTACIEIYLCFKTQVVFLVNIDMGPSADGAGTLPLIYILEFMNIANYN